MDYNDKWNLFTLVGLLFGVGISFFNHYFTAIYYPLFIAFIMIFAPSNDTKRLRNSKLKRGKGK